MGQITRKLTCFSNKMSSNQKKKKFKANTVFHSIGSNLQYGSCE